MRHARAAAPLPAFVLALAPMLSGCGAGDPTYYRLSPWPGQPVAAAGLAVDIAAPDVAPYLDRDYIVESVSDYRLHLAGNDAWAEPIGDMVGRTLAADLAQRLPNDRVGGGASAPGGTPDARVELAITRFDRDGSGTALLRGTLTLRDAGGATLANVALDLAAPGTGAGSAAFAAAESRLLGDVADRAAAVLATRPDAAPQAGLQPAG